jgi:hypothetical protein
MAGQFILQLPRSSGVVLDLAVGEFVSEKQTARRAGEQYRERETGGHTAHGKAAGRRREVY